MSNQKEYEIEVRCKAASLPIISLPEIYSTNMASKTSTLNVVNNSEAKGVYRARIDPEHIFSLDSLEF